jgi:predicted GH43/DUF377 family glycosyl hydrolase
MAAVVLIALAAVVVYRLHNNHKQTPQDQLQTTALPSWAIGPFTRYAHNPILAPPINPTDATSWEWPELFNPGVVVVNGVFHMIYRGDDFAGVSSIGAATSTNGYQFTTASDQPVISPTLPSETGGVEDPRLYYFAGHYYAFFTGNFGSGSDINEAVSTNGQDWTQIGPVLKNTKDAAVVVDPQGAPVLIGGHYLMYYGQMGAAYLAQSIDFVHWTTVGRVTMNLPASYEPWELCVAVTNYSTTSQGGATSDIDLFVAGGLVSHGRWYYAIGQTEIDPGDLRTVKAVLKTPSLYPQAPYEIYGHTPQTVFMNNIIFYQNQWWMYYGAGDSDVALAQAPLR